MLPYLVIGLLLVGVLAVVVLVLVLATWRLQVPEVAEVGREEYPVGPLERQKNLGVQLAAAGFAFAGLQRERRGPKYEVWQVLFRTGDGSVWAVVEAIRNEQPRIVFHSYFANGRAVTTSNGEFADYQVSDEWRLTERAWETLRAQATHHHQRLLGAGGQPLGVTTAEEFRGVYLDTAYREFAHLERRGFLRGNPKDGDEFRVSPLRAPGLALRMLLHSRRYKWAEQGRRRDEAAQIRVAAEHAERRKVPEATYLDFYQRDKKRGTALSLLGWTGRGAILFVSILLVLVFAFARGALDVQTVGVILAILLVHELGHVAMMCLFGYRDMSVLFLPLAGLLARRRRRRVPAGQEFVTLLMGPLPGLLAGWALLAAGYFVPDFPPFWQKVGLWAALINNLNLLPVLPCDGGRIVNLLIFDRVPALRVAYLLASCMAVIVLAFALVLALGIPAMTLAGPAVIIGLSAILAVPDNRRLARVTPWAKHNLSPEEDESEALVKAFLIVERTDSVRALEKRGWTDDVDRVVKLGCARKLGVVATGVALLVTAGGLLAPLWMLIGVAVGEGAQVRSEHREIADRLAALAPSVSWSGAAVTTRTRDDLELLRDTYQGGLEALYAGTGGLEFAVQEFTYDARGIFDPSVAVEKVRALRWDEVSTWVGEEDTEARQETARILVETLIGNARDKAEAGNLNGALVGYSKACWAVSTCEPKTSLAAWIDWLQLEHRLLEEVGGHLAERGMSAHYSRWFANTLRSRPRFEGEKLALLLLYDLQGSRVPFAPPASGLDGEAFDLEALIAEAGYPLRRSDSERGLREGRGGVATGWDLRRFMGATRILQGLPTREEFRAGIVIAEAWATAGDFDSSVLDRVEDAAQRAVWQRRIDHIQRLVHYRLLAAVAFELELAATADEGEDPRPPGRLGMPVRTRLVTTPGDRFAVASTAPDGTQLVFRLSPQFAQRRGMQ